MTNAPPLVIVLPFCGRDAALQLRSIEWQAEIGVKWGECVLSYDSTAGQWVDRIEQSARKVYATVRRHQYSPPPHHYWPPNRAWQSAAVFMSALGSPWLFMEGDMVALSSDFPQVLDREYRRRGKKFMGPVIPELFHVNGTSIYPAETPQILTRAMHEASTAWDVAAADQMIPETHDAMHLIYHLWSINGGVGSHSDGGEEPNFPTQESLRLIPPTAVLFHRCKNESLRARLREAMK